MPSVCKIQLLAPDCTLGRTKHKRA